MSFDEIASALPPLSAGANWT